MRYLIGLAILAMVAAPASANLLSATDGGFEDPWTDGAPDWFSQKQNGLIERDSGIHGPGPAPQGSHYGSLQTGGNVGHAAWITIPASGPLSLDMWVAGGTTGATATLFVELRDGNENGAVLDAWSANLPNPYGFGWTKLSSASLNNEPLTGVATSGQVTVKVGYSNLVGWSNGTAIHIDDVVLTPEPASLALFSLLGLPLLRRRRRA
ncbi:MAG: hypothetical protein AMXMBFR13_21640 [Phycisphaerae bacterium]